MAYKPKTTSTPLIPPIGGITANTKKPQFKLGTVVSDVNGNIYRYVQAKEALKVGEVVTAVPAGTWDGILINGKASPGDAILFVDGINTARDNNFYAGYWIMQAAGAKKGLSYQIKSHSPFSKNGKAAVMLEGQIEETFADNTALKIFNPYLVEKIDATTKVPRGVALADISKNYYGFVQIGGYVRAVKVGHSASAAIVVNEPLVPVAANPGAMQGFAGALEANILEAALGAFVSLDAVALNTPGYIPALIQGQL